MSKRRKKTGRSWIRNGATLVPLVALFAVIGEFWPAAHAVLLDSPALSVKRVVVSGNEFLTPSELLDLGHVRPGMPLLALKPRAVEGRLALHPRVASAEVSYSFPRGVRVRVIERSPIAQVEFPAAEGGLRPISADGVLLPPVPGRPLENLPIIAADDVLRQGDLVREPDVIEALEFIDELSSVDARLVSSLALIDVNDERFGTVSMDSLDTALVYEKGGRWKSHLRVLPGVIADLTHEHVLGTVLDLRFREQIVRRGGVFAHDEFVEHHAKNRREAN